MRPNQPYTSGAIPGIELPSNEICLHFQTLFFEIFGNFPSNADAVENEWFYSHLYVPRLPLRVEETSVTKEFPCLKKVQFGEDENDLAEFVLDNYRNILVLIGKVGHGKTTLTRYLLEYLLPHNKETRELVKTLRIDCFHHRSSLERGATGPETSVPDFLDDHINSYVLNDLEEKVDVDNNSFWETISNTKEFKHLKAIERNLEKIEGEDGPHLREKIHSERFEELKKTNFYLHCLSYYSLIKKTVVFVFDNVDALSAEAQIAILDYAIELTDSYQCKAIVPMRGYTWEHIGRKFDDHERKLTLTLKDPDIHAILQKRTSNFTKKLEANYENTPLILKDTGIKVELKDLRKALDSLHGYLLNEDVVANITLFSGGNIRSSFQLIGRIYRSGHIRASGFLSGLLGLKTSGEYPGLSLWTFWHALYCGPHSTFVSPKYHGVAPGVLNILHNGSYSGLFSHFFRTLLLSRLSGLIGRANLPYSQLRNEAEQLVPGKENECKEQLQYAVFRMINAGLICSPDVYELYQFDELQHHDSYRMQISELGKNYLDSYLRNFIYISLIKDDADIGKMPIPYKTMMESGKLSERFRNTLKFLLYLGRQEKDFYGLCGDDNATLKTWQSGFKDNAMNPVVHRISGGMVAFARTHKQKIPQYMIDRAERIESHFYSSS